MEKCAICLCLFFTGCVTHGVHRYHAAGIDFAAPAMSPQRVELMKTFEAVCVRHGLVRTVSEENMIVYQASGGDSRRAVLTLGTLAAEVVVFEGAATPEWDSLRADLLQLLKEKLPTARIEYHEEGPSPFS
jgi:hypothetical protein